MEWCDHCLRFSQTMLDVDERVSPNIFISTCFTCGKLLSDSTTPPPLHKIFPNTRKIKNSTRMKRVGKPKHYVKKADKTDLSSNDQKIDSDSVSVDAISKEEKQPINADTVQTSDNH